MARKKRIIYSEAAYLFGILFLALGTALVEKANFGVSMVVAPAYLIHLKLSEFWGFVSFGMAEYLLQGFIILLVALIVRRFRLSYLFTFVTAVLYGLILDFFITLISFVTVEAMYARIILFIIGIPITSLGVAFMFHTYISPEAYELFVKEITDRFKLNMGIFKTFYDIGSLLVSVVMSFAFFGFGVFKGIGAGTVICALCNGLIIGLFGRYMDKNFDFPDKFKLRKYFENNKGL